LNRFVVDPSVAAKWFLPARGEPLVNEALDLLSQYVADEVQFLVPDLLWAELGNLLWKAARQKRCSVASAEAAISTARQYKIPTVGTESLIERAFAIAATFDRTVYDSIYAALAVEAKTHLVTADEKLAAALAAHMPVKWLGSL
jgi:predicted nucleic acid-binding protein